MAERYETDNARWRENLLLEVARYQSMARDAGMTDAYDTRDDYEHTASVLQELINDPSQLDALIARERAARPRCHESEYRHIQAYSELERQKKALRELEDAEVEAEANMFWEGDLDG